MPHRSDYLELLTFSEREFADLLNGCECRQVELGQQTGCGVFVLSPANEDSPAAELGQGEVLGARQVAEGAPVLERRGDPAPARLAEVAWGKELPVQAHRPGVRDLKPTEALDERRLPGA